MKIDLRDLRQVTALAKHRNFGRAAEELCISQPALSRSIRILEGRLGVSLFDRHSRDISPTLYGERVLSLGTHLLKEAAHLERDLELHKKLGAGEVVVGSGPFPAEMFVGVALGRLSAKYPRLNIRVVVDRTPRLFGLLENSEIDIMVADTRVIEEIGDTTLIPLPSIKARLFCRAGHPLAGQGNVSPKDCMAFPIASMWIPREVRETLFLEDGCSTEGLLEMRSGSIECDSLKVLLDAVIASDAIGITLNSIYREQIEAEQIVLLPFEAPDFRSAYGVVTLNRYSLAPAVTALCSCLIEAAHELINAD